MINNEAKNIIKLAYLDSTEEEIENLRWHLKNETPVLCGKEFSTIPFTDDKGG
jgi:hypothetical protein